MIKKINLNILIPICLLAIISIVAIYGASPYTSKSLGNLVLKQTLWYIVGIFLVIFLIKMKNEYLYRHTNFLYILGNVLLLGLLFFATPINSSKCWYIIPGIGSFQPSEFMKIFIVLILAKTIHDFRSDYDDPTIKEEGLFILKTFIILLIPSILTFLEPDTGSVIIYFIIYLSMMFTSGIRIRWFIFVLIFVFVVLMIVLGLYFFNEKLFINIFGTDLFYRLERIFDWKNGSGLQLENAKAAIGSAGLFGYGIKNNPIYFPEASTDFIFAIFASNFGFFGVVLLTTITIFLDISIIKEAQRKINDTDKYILIGIISMLIFQQIQNIGMTIGLFPIMGITLPFISYGGSSLLSYMLIVGIIINISMEKTKHYKYK